jgi:hypothetical protein
MRLSFFAAMPSILPDDAPVEEYLKLLLFSDTSVWTRVNGASKRKHREFAF